MIMLNLLKKRMSGTKEVIRQYMNQDNIDMNGKNIKIPLKKTLHKVLRIWQLDIIFPLLILIVLFLYLIKNQIVQLLALGLIIYSVYEHFHRPKPKVDHEKRYKWLQDFIYNPISYMRTLLPVEPVQSLYDISSPNRFLLEGGYIVYAYQLMKSTAESIDKPKLNFAKKVLQERINKKMDEYDSFYGRSDTVYLDARVLMVTDITDMGTHCIVKVLFIDSPVAYKYWQHLNTPKKSRTADTYDEDF